GDLMRRFLNRLGGRFLAASSRGILLTVLALPLLESPRACAGEDLPRGMPEEVGCSSERLRRINDVVQRHVDEHHIAGAVTLVARKGRVVHLEAQGLMDLESKRPMKTDTLFRMASSTKPVTGVAVMMMLEEGRVRLTDPVSKFIPDFKGMKVAIQRDAES